MYNTNTNTKQTHGVVGKTGIWWVQGSAVPSAVTRRRCSYSESATSLTDLALGVMVEYTHIVVGLGESEWLSEARTLGQELTGGEKALDFGLRV